MLNEVTIIGNLGRDPEGFDTRNGKGCKLSVATSRKIKGDDGSWSEEETEWHRVVVFGKSAEFCLNYLEKGRKVFVRGRLKTSSYDKDGVKRYSTDIIADNFRGILALDKGGSGGGSSGAGEGSGQSTFSDDAEDVPF